MNDDLLVKHLLGEASTAEQAAVTAWLAADAAHRKHYKDMQTIWEQSRQLARRSPVDEQAAWQRFQERVQNAEAAPTRTIAMRQTRYRLRLAAAVITLMSAGWLLYYFLGTGQPVLMALETGDAVRTDTLPDGSVITLSRHSKLSYPQQFAGQARRVALDGAAFFNISPDKAKPFIITAHGVDITVVGTSFNVRSSATQTAVVVTTGIVEVKQQREAIMLHPHEQATVLRGAARPVKGQADELLYRFYRDRQIEFVHTPLWRAARVLSDAYGTEIILGDPALRDKPIVSTFRQSESIEEVLSVIDATLNTSHELQDGKYIIKPR